MENSGRGVVCPLLCPICHKHIETMEYVFKDCLNANQICFASNLGMSFHPNSLKTFAQWLGRNILRGYKGINKHIASIIYSTWLSRHASCFENKNINAIVSVRKTYLIPSKYTVLWISLGNLKQERNRK